MSAEMRLLCPMCREVVVITPDAPGICPCGFVLAEVGEPYAKDGEGGPVCAACSGSGFVGPYFCPECQAPWS